MVSLRNYGVGTGYTSDGVTGKKSVFSQDENIFAVHVWDDLKGGEVFKIEFQRLEAGNYVTKKTLTWTNPTYTSAYQQAKFWDWSAGKYRCRFLLNNIFGGGKTFTIEAEVPVLRRIRGKVTNKLTGDRLAFAKITFGTKSVVSLANGWYEMLDPEFISGPITCELPGFETVEKLITAPVEGDLTVDFELTAVAPPEITWWEKLLAFIIDPVLKPFLVSDLLFKEGYELLTGKEMTMAEYEIQKLKLADWVLPINVLLKLFTGRNLKGEAEEFGSAGDWIETSVLLAAALFPGFADDVAVRLGTKTVTKTQAAKIVKTMGEKRTVDALVRTVKAHPETSAKFLSKFPAAVRNAVINGLGKTAYGREIIYILGKYNYFKYTAPGLKGFLAGVSGYGKWFMILAGSLAGYITFANFLAWVGKEALIETLSFPIWKLIDEEDWDGVLKHIGALRKSIELADDAMILTKPIPLIAGIWKGFIDNANIQADIYEKIARDALEEIKETGVLTVSCTVEKSDVYIDGIKVGVTPFERELEVGTYHILVTKFGYDSTEIDVDIVAGATPHFSAEILPLEPPPTGKGKVDIAVQPTDAVLEVAGHPEITKMGAYELDLGTYTIKASKEGYYDKSATAIVKEAEITEVSIVLTKKEVPLLPEEVRGTLTISITPEDAKIEVAGEEEITSPGTYELAPGSYAVRVSKEGFVTDIKTAFVSELKDTAISFILKAVEPVPPVIEKATITITSDPIDSDVYIDGVYKWTTTPYTILLDVGAYWIRVQRDGYYPVEIEVEVEASEVSELPFVLTKIPDPEIPPYPYIPQTPYYPTYVPDVPYVPDVVTTPTAEVPPYTYDLLYTPTFPILEPEPISRPTERELLINIETTDVKPWKGRIYSIALLELSEPEAEPKILISNNEQELIEMFITWFDAGNYAKLVGFKLTFDYRYIFAKMMLYRITNKKFYDIKLRDVKQLLDQVKEEFVYYPDKTGTLNDWGKALLGRGKYGSQELMLRKYISGDFDYVNNFQLRQIEITRDLYNLARFSMGEAFISTPSPITSPILTPETPELAETPVLAQQKQCPTCFAFIDKATGKCPICAPAI